MTQRFRWIAEADRVAHCVDHRGRSLCGLYGIDPRRGWPAEMRCESCVEMLTLLTGRALGRMQHASLWWIGDWWNFGDDHKYGDLKRAAEETGIPSATIRGAAWVARQCVSRLTVLSWKHHQALAALSPSEQEPWLRHSAEGDGKKPWTVRQLKDEMRAVATRERLADVTQGDDFTIVAGDFREAEITAGSVDWIITDPPYPAEFLPLFGDLSTFAERVLRPGGSLLAMVGQSYLPTVMALLGERLTYQWTLAYLTPGGQAVQLWDRKVNTFWKPLLWYVKGDYAGKWIGDVSRSDVNDNDKRFHGWGQSESGMADIIARLTEPGDMVLDPFAGGGTTGIVARALGRRFLGIELRAELVPEATDGAA